MCVDAPVVTAKFGADGKQGNIVLLGTPPFDTVEEGLRFSRQDRQLVTP